MCVCGAFRLQAGKYGVALELTKIALKWEEKELGGRTCRLAELYSLMAEVYDEVSRDKKVFCMSSARCTVQVRNGL